ncbi:hypothetical protein ElyMa_005420500 [Elysia marginata]|uniref:Uncharacterized protein n=1 Tax=Elysia marginata TaxID=1093978 RepID=A0AAV4EKI9_9GAST|nr:hypothetical protein ElyMa_005420500 [Elysia marginata]
MEKEAGENKGKNDGWTKALAGIWKFDIDNDSYGTSGVMEKHDRRCFKAWHWTIDDSRYTRSPTEEIIRITREELSWSIQFYSAFSRFFNGGHKKTHKSGYGLSWSSKYSSSAISRGESPVAKTQGRPTLLSTSSIPRRIVATKTKRRRSPHKDPLETLVKTPCPQTNVCNDSSSDSTQKKTTSEPRPKEQDTQVSRQPRSTKQNRGF